MKVTIRQETKDDHRRVEEIVKAAFRDEPLSDQTEHLLVRRLRNSQVFIPELSIVAEADGKIVGHILLTKIKINNGETSFDSLALAPVSVMPEFQNRGIGGHLIREAHRVARELGFGSVVLLGHAGYYPKFGYEKASKYGISLPFEAPPENCMAIELIKGGLDDVNGLVEYPKNFFE